MNVFGLVGWSGAGKTTLMVALLQELASRGVSVSTMKHAHHNFDVDKPGKDSYEHRAAGAREVLVTSANRWALMHELQGAPEPDIDTLIGRMTPVDLLLIEGFKHHSHTKLEVHRPSLCKPLLAHDDPRVVAVASDAPIEGLGVPRLDLDDVAGIANFILARTGIGARGAA